ncbi:hypothetical protein ACFWMS_23650 [Peribacillus butanolivorans]|uniref:hypothetical protein n=1 Tax=Peribacillus butanolivorans TaxID=421767 RepID=UPI0036598931
MEPRRFKKKPRRIKKKLRTEANIHALVIPILWFLMMLFFPALILSGETSDLDFFKNFYQNHQVLTSGLSLGTGVFCCVMGIKKLRISTRAAREIEIWGYALLFFALIWQFVLIDSKNSFYDDYAQEEITIKLDHIWNYMHKMDTDSESEKYFEISNGDGYDEFHGHKKNEDSTETDEKILYGLVYFISTVFIAIGRFHEIKGINN